MDDRLAKHMIENNLLVRLMKAESDVALLQKLYVGQAQPSIIGGGGTPTQTNEEEYGLAGEAVAYGELMYQSSVDSHWRLVDASADTTCKNRLGICLLAAANDGDTTRVLINGKVTSPTFPVMVSGTTMYASVTPGAISATPPSANPGEIIRIAGHAIGVDELYFHPSNDYFELGLAP